MAIINVSFAGLSSQLQQILNCGDIVPGSAPSYETCKILYSYHPHGAKIVDFPLLMAQSKPRRITIPKGPEERLTEAFEAQWKKDQCTKHIRNLHRLKRIYGVASLALMVKGVTPDRPVDYKKLANAKISFNGLDPLNTAGSLVLDQDPNSMDFLKTKGIAVAGTAYHRSRTITALNEDPIYIQWTDSAYGYVGRSVFQRALFAMKSFVNTMVTDDMVSVKAGLIVAKMAQQSGVIDEMMRKATGKKRDMLQEAQTGNILSISTEEAIESLNLQNLEGPLELSRKNIIENEAAGAGMPAKILLSETFAAGFGEGTEDAKHIAQFIETLQEEMEPSYEWMDRIIWHRAWNEEFYKTIQNDFPDSYRGKSYNQAFYEWTNSYKAEWPSLLEEPESEKIKVADVQLRAIIGMIESFTALLDPYNKVVFIQACLDNINSLKMLFPTPFELDVDLLQEFLEDKEAVAKEQAENMAQMAEDEGEPKPKNNFADADVAAGRVAKALENLQTSVSRVKSRVQ